MVSCRQWSRMQRQPKSTKRWPNMAASLRWCQPARWQWRRRGRISTHLYLHLPPDPRHHRHHHQATRIYQQIRMCHFVVISFTFIFIVFFIVLVFSLLGQNLATVIIISSVTDPPRWWQSSGISQSLDGIWNLTWWCDNTLHRKESRCDNIYVQHRKKGQNEVMRWWNKIHFERSSDDSK